MSQDWDGVHNRDLHFSTGARAWCHCGDWCYPHDPCSCCEKEALGDQTAAEVLAELDRQAARAEAAEAEVERLSGCIHDVLDTWRRGAHSKAIRHLGQLAGMDGGDE